MTRAYSSAYAERPGSTPAGRPARCDRMPGAMTLAIAGSPLLFVLCAFAAEPYQAERTTDHDVPIVRLADSARDVRVSIVPSIGNRAYEMKVHGKDILYFPFPDVSEFQKRPTLSGVPFLAPWADLLDEPAFWANGKRYPFNMGLGNVHGSMPGHGLLT